MYTVFSEPFPEKWNEFFHLFCRKIPRNPRKLSQQQVGKMWELLFWACVALCKTAVCSWPLFVCCIYVRKNSIPFGYCGLCQHYSCLFPGLNKLGKSPCVQPILGVSCFSYCQGASISSLTHCSHIMEAGTAEIKQHRELVRNVNDIAPIVSNVYSIVLTIVFQLKKCWWACMMKPV